MIPENNTAYLTVKVSKDNDLQWIEYILHDMYIRFKITKQEYRSALWYLYNEGIKT